MGGATGSRCAANGEDDAKVEAIKLIFTRARRATRATLFAQGLIEHLSGNRSVKASSQLLHCCNLLLQLCVRAQNGIEVILLLHERIIVRTRMLDIQRSQLNACPQVSRGIRKVRQCTRSFFCDASTEPRPRQRPFRKLGALAG